MSTVVLLNTCVGLCQGQDGVGDAWRPASVLSCRRKDLMGKGKQAGVVSLEMPNV